jgi:hypothetical protein
MLPPVSRLTDALIAAGYPIQCVNTNIDGTFTVTLDSTGTPEQQTAVDAFVASYVDAPMIALPLSTIIANINALTTAQKTKLQILVVALAIQANPQLGALVGVVVAGDQPQT